MNVTEFQKDLKNMSLNEALNKHEVTLHQAFKEFHNRTYAKRNTKYWSEKSLKKISTGERYIGKSQGMFFIRKTINGKLYYFGRYSTLEDAVKVRDYMIKYGWNKSMLNSICRKLGVEK